MSKIKYSDLFQDDGGIDALIAKINQLEKEYKQLGEVITGQIKEVKTESKNVNIVDPNSAKRIGELEKKIASLTKRLGENRKAKSQIEKLREKSIQLQTNEAKVAQTLKLQIQDQTRALKNEIIVEKQQEGSLKKLEATLRQNIEKYRSLSAAERENRKVGGALLKTIKQQDAEVKKLNETIGRSQGSVGNYKRAFEGLKGVFMRGLGALGITAGLVGLVNVIKSSIGIFASFEKANSNLAAILGATDDEMNKLNASAKLLGATTAFTATQVVELQTEFAKLGYPTEDIDNMTESTLNAAAAMGSDLAATAKLTGATLRSFGLESTEAARVNDVLARATTASALDFEKLNASMSTIAPVANSFGFSLEGTTALLGQLSNAGFDASSAATATRNLLLNLADSSSKLGKSLNEPVTDLPSLVKGLKQLKGEGIDLGKALELTDKRSVAAFSTFLEGTDDVLELNKALQEANGTAEEMASKQLDNLSGAVTILNSAWEGFILSLEDGNGSFARTLKNIVRVVTELLSLASGTEKLKSELTGTQLKIREFAESIISFSKVLASLVIGFIAYKTVLIASRVATAAYNAVTKVAAFTTGLFKNGLRGATTAFKGLNTTMKANPIGLVLSALTAIITALALFKDETDAATESFNNFRNELLAGRKSIEERFEVVSKLSEAQLKQLKSDIELQLALEEKFNEKSILNAQERSKKLQKELIDLNEEIAKETERFNNAQTQEQFKIADERLNGLEKERNAILLQVEAVNKESVSNSELLKNKERLLEINRLLNKETSKGNVISSASVGLLEENTEALKAAKKELDAATTQEGIDEQLKNIEKLEKRRRDLLGKTREEIEKGNRELRENIAKLNEEYLIGELDAQRDKELESLRISEEAEKERIRNSSESEKEKNEKLLELEKETLDKKAEINRRYAEQIELQQLETALDADIKDTKNTVANYEVRTQKILELERKAQQDRDAIRRKYAKLEQDQIDDANKLKFIKEQELEKKKRDEQRRTTDLAINTALNALSTIQDAEKEKLNNEIDATKNQVTTQQKLASDGLENTLAFEEAQLAKLEQKKLAADKKAIRLEKIKALYSAYSAAAGSDDSQAVLTVLKDFAILQGIESTLLSFGTGTGEHGTFEDAIEARGGSKGGNSIKKGIVRGEKHRTRGYGIPVLVEGDEGMLSGRQMGNLGKDNFIKLASALDKGVLGTDIFGSQISLVPQINTVNVDFKKMESKLDSVKKAIDNKPVQQVNVESLSNSYTDFIDTTITGNKKLTNRYRVNKKRV